MKDRLTALLSASGRSAMDVWVSTFHSFCARLIRREAAALGLPRDFAIYDDDDQNAAVKRALAQAGLKTEDYPPRAVRSQISHAKNHGITADEMESSATTARDDARKDISKVFRVYEEILRKAASLDFDDLLLRAVDLLKDNPAIRAAWSSRFQYIMVDEFQDTNRAQEELVRLLAGQHKNVCVVGDEDQSIYGWRGARAGDAEALRGIFPRHQSDPPRRKLPLHANHPRRCCCRREEQFRPSRQNTEIQPRRWRHAPASTKPRTPSPKPNTSSRRSLLSFATIPKLVSPSSTALARNRARSRKFSGATTFAIASSAASAFTSAPRSATLSLTSA